MTIAYLDQIDQLVDALERQAWRLMMLILTEDL